MTKNDNRTKIKFTYEGRDFTLVFSADALKKMERKYGVKFAKLDDQILTAGEELFCGAFIENHNEVPRAKREEIYKALCDTMEGGSESVNDVLIEMVNEAIEEIKPKGNVVWKVERKA